jgi:hypothetical protein
MAMPAEMATQGPNPEEMAIYEQMRQQISPQEFSNEMLAGASQVDPQAVAEFTQELQGLDMPPEALDALNDVVDEILANPEQYDQLRSEYLEAGLPEDILPEQFDPQFFAALNMAIDQMIAAPTGVQAFAKGGIAELKPIAKAIASYGRNGDTMLAHITPAEARMLRRRGGSGTINPDTGLPEFFIKKLWKNTVGKVLKSVGKQLKSVGRAVKKFAQSSIGRIVLPIALGFFLGPAAASFMGVTSAAGVAAVSGFVGSSLSTVAAGGNLKDALKAGAIGGLTAGAGAGVMGGSGAFASGSYTGPTTIGGQFDAFKSATGIGAAPVVDAPAPVPGTGPQGIGPNQMPVPDAAPYSDLPMTGTPVKPFPEFFGDQASAAAPAPMYDPATATRAVDYGYKPGGTGTAPAYKPGGPTIGESFSKMGEGLGMGDTPASFDTFKQGASDLFSPGPSNAQLTARAREIMVETPGTSLKDAMTLAKEMSPGILRTYGPAAVAGIGAMSAFGGFDTKPVEGGPITQSLMKTADERIREKGTQRQMYMQGLPGVVYDEFGAPVFGQSTRLPTYDVPDYDSGGFRNYGMGNSQGIMNVPTMYNTPAGSIGSRSVAQPYNNSDMYSNIMPRGYAEGGPVTDLFRSVLKRDPSVAEIDNWKRFGDTIDERERAEFREAAKAELDSNAAANKAAQEAKGIEQKAARDARAQEKAMRRAAGSGQMYANINAGLSALAPETNPINSYFAANPDVKAAYYSSSSPLSQAEFARQHFSQYGKTEGRADPGSYGDELFGARNRTAAVAQRQAAYAPMLQGQRFAMDQQAGIAASGQLPRDVSGYSGQDKAELYRGMARQGMTDAQIRAAAENRYGMQSDTDWRGLQNIVTPPGGPITTMPIASPITQPPVNVVGPITPSPIAPPGDTETIRINPPPGIIDLSGEPGANVGPYLTPQQIANTPGMGMGGIGVNTRFMNMGGIAALAAGGYPRRTGQISGPGTEKSDSIPAMLSDGEFVMTAKAVRGAGKGNRRAGAKQMYKLMHQLEKNSERG